MSIELEKARKCEFEKRHFTSKERAGADIYLTADLRYNDFMRHENAIILADMGHFESEYCAIQLLFDILSKKIPIFAVRKSVCSRNPVNYMMQGSLERSKINL